MTESRADPAAILRCHLAPAMRADSTTVHSRAHIHRRIIPRNTVTCPDRLNQYTSFVWLLISLKTEFRSLLICSLKMITSPIRTTINYSTLPEVLENAGFSFHLVPMCKLFSLLTSKKQTLELRSPRVRFTINLEIYFLISNFTFLEIWILNHLFLLS